MPLQLGKDGGDHKKRQAGRTSRQGAVARLRAGARRYAHRTGDTRIVDAPQTRDNAEMAIIELV